MSYLGLGKTLFNSSISIISENPFNIEVFITERLTREKYSGSWPLVPLKKLTQSNPTLQYKYIIENSDVLTCRVKEEALNKSIPFYASLQKQGLEAFSQEFNKNIQFITHHEAHAYNAIAYSPFTEALVVVIDGGGSRAKCFNRNDLSKNDNEYLSAYQYKNNKLTLINKKFQHHEQAKHANDLTLSSGPAAFYEIISQFIFNDKHSAGKVMGLAPYGKSITIPNNDYINFLNSLDWGKSFKGKSKKEWENSKHQKYYQDLAATAQVSFENHLLNFLKEYTQISKNIIITGGGALNCTFNWKLSNLKLFENIFIPPAPNDLGISLGCAYYEFSKRDKPKTPLNSPFLGPFSSMPENFNIEKIFNDYKVLKKENIAKTASEILLSNEVIAWFQGRSEIGPRALGHRSILASVKKPNLKNYLNEKIKFRESFRPYACSVLQEDAHILFDIDKSFRNPYMSFAVQCTPKYQEFLSEVLHIDNTNRMQTVDIKENYIFYNLLSEIKKELGFGVLLNTSLNIMGQPIVETPLDLLDFFKKSEIQKIIIGNYLIEK